jgi:hypothetical protein
LLDPKFGCQPADVPFWLGAAAIVLAFSFFGFFDSRLPLAMPSPWVYLTSDRVELYHLLVQAGARSFLLRARYVEVLTLRNHLPIVSYP